MRKVVLFLLMACFAISGFPLGHGSCTGYGCLGLFASKTVDFRGENREIVITIPSPKERVIGINGPFQPRFFDLGGTIRIYLTKMPYRSIENIPVLDLVVDKRAEIPGSGSTIQGYYHIELNIIK